MKELIVSLTAQKQDRSYPILVEEGLLTSCGEVIAAQLPARRAAIVTDSNVGPLYAATVEASLQKAGFAVKTVTIPAGEKSKSLETLRQIYHELLAEEPFAVSRTDLIVALGGGVVGDVAGFAAATLLRGVPYLQIPTTVLAQVDSSVGGKVAVDLAQGKNLAGAFYQPRMVLMDPLTLNTLSDRVFFDGMGEVVKYGVIRDAELFCRLEGCAGRLALMRQIDDIILTCCDIKRQVVEEDEQDTGMRMILNFGHTLGHAYEKWGRYETYTHGEAVSCGMCSILKIGEAHGFTQPGTGERVRRLLARYGIPTQAPRMEREELSHILSHDKKGSGDKLTVVMAQQIGQCSLVKMPRAQFLDWCEEAAL